MRLGFYLALVIANAGLDLPARGSFLKRFQHLCAAKRQTSSEAAMRRARSRASAHGRVDGQRFRDLVSTPEAEFFRSRIDPRFSF